MQYRKLGKLDVQVSALGYGCMRLPTAENNANSPNILEQEAIGLIRHAIDGGVNYIDTAYMYHDGQSEFLVGKALKDGYRDKVHLVTKSPMVSIKTVEDYDRILDEQLMKLDVDHIDFYLLHALTEKNWKMILDLDLIGRSEAAKKAGKIGHIGFSFHDSYEVFEEIIGAYDKWDLCQIQYNFMDEEVQAGTKGLKLAASKGIGVIVMEPLRGGKLAAPIQEVADLLKKRDYQGTLPDLALRWVWNHPEVSVALGGMTKMSDVQQNLASAEKGLPGAMSEEELRLVEEIRTIYAKRTGVPCTGCGYCMPCPQKIKIPFALDQYNDATIYDYAVESKRLYDLFGGNAVNCIACGECEKKCPQGIPISKWMGKIHELLGASPA